jgi:hypothetical protein
MELIRGGMKAPIAMDWQTAPDFTGVGADISSSAGIALYYPTIDIVDCYVEVQFTQSPKTHAWVKFNALQQYDTSNRGAVLSTFYTGRIDGHISQPRTRRIIMRLPAIYHNRPGDTNLDSIAIYVEAKGPEGIEWSVTNIKARLIYTPL